MKILPDRTAGKPDIIKPECGDTHSGMKLFEVDDLDRYPMADALGDGMCGPTGAHIPEGQHQVGLGDDPAVPDQRSPPAVGFIVRQIFRFVKSLDDSVIKPLLPQ